MRVLVTGGTGFIGSNLVQALVESDHQPITLSRRVAGLPGVEHHSLEINSPEAIELASGVDAVVHLAALSDASGSMGNPLLYNQVNALGTLSMLEGARRGGARFVFASSQRIYRPSREPIPEDGVVEPQDPYGYSKLSGEKWVEMYVRFYELSGVVLRFFSVFGPGLVISSGASGVVGIFVRKAAGGEPITVHANQSRDLTYVGDVCRGILLALERPATPGSCYNIATGVGTSMEELATQVCRVSGSSSKITVEDSQQFGYLVADVRRARSELDYSPQFDLVTGLERYIAWYRDHR